jgi:hypothetical protein
MIDGETARTTQVLKSPNPISNPMDLIILKEWCALLDALNPNNLASLLGTSNSPSIN